MAEWTFDQAQTKQQLAAFFQGHSSDLRKFGLTVNQTFEAFVFASTLQWYKDNGWRVSIKNPRDKKTKNRSFRLKFSTRGEPERFSYAVCKKGNRRIQIRHQLRVATDAHIHDGKNFANVCLDVAVIRNVNLTKFKTYHALNNKDLVSFGEAKHMSGYAELIAGFIGLVHELQPSRLRFHSLPTRRPWHVSPFLFISGLLYRTGAGLAHTISRRGFDLEIYTSAKGLSLRQQRGQQAGGPTRKSSSVSKARNRNNMPSARLAS